MKSIKQSNDFSRSYIGVAFEKDALNIIEGILSSILDIDDYFYILHDQDDDIPNHYHFYVKFNQSLPVCVAREWLGDDCNRIRPCYASEQDTVEYFLQRRYGGRVEHVYDLSDLRGNIDFSDYK